MKFFTITVFLFLSPVAIYGGHRCNKPCPQYLNPVCVEDKDGNHKWFPNICDLQIAQCKYPRKEYQMVDICLCNITNPACEKPCPFAFHPVCAKDKYGHDIIFPNKCVFEVVQCEEPEKEYQLVDIRKCNAMHHCTVKSCPRDHHPVCAKDKDGNIKAFSNKCMFENAQCQHQEKVYKLVALSKCGITPNCHKSCTFLYHPVCAEDKDGNHQEFVNNCVFEIAQCEHPEKEYKLIDLSKCRMLNCTTPCTKEYNPVCAEDKNGNHETFGNKCIFENARCAHPEKEYKLVGLSRCAIDPGCIKPCPAIYHPVCAEDKNGNHHEFPNQCAFEVAKCEHPEKKYKLVDLIKCSMPNCNKPCTREYNPVCAEDKNGNHEAFANKCIFENARCAHPEKEYKLVALSKCAISSGCIKPCPVIYHPVCAEDKDGNHHTFPNQCAFEVAKCEHSEKKYKLVDLSKCRMPNCNKPCPKEYNPVCAEDKNGNHETFGNKCIFEIARCAHAEKAYKLVDLSKCGITPNCLKPCILDFNPVCAEDKDGNTKQFPNKCFFEVVQCAQPEKEYKLVDLRLCDCNKICPLIVLPVCAEDKNGNHNQFPSNCVFEVEKCKHPEKEYKLVDLSMCSTPSCIKLCTLEYNPVCAEDKGGNHITFPNKCVFENAQCEQPEKEYKLVDLSKCGITPNCLKPCILDFNPVCAEDKDGNTKQFPNKCFFEVVQCAQPEKEYKLVDLRLCDCNKICPLIVLPVCAEDKNGNHNQFPNNCVFEVEKCKHPEKEYKLVDLSMCSTPSCIKLCTLEYNPVCAEDKGGNHITFPNKCVFENAQCEQPEKEYKLVDLSKCGITPNCLKPCTFDYNPICAEDKDGNNQEFPNKCTFEVIQCAYPEKEYKLVDLRLCRCNKICPLILLPVCAEDKDGNHKQFPNNCVFEVEKCNHPEKEYKLVDLSMCSTPSCIKLCTLEYNPVCAEDKGGNHITFPNKCVFENAQCEQQEKEYKLVDLSKCGITPNCLKPCTFDYNSVCAEDKDGNNIQFPNNCSFMIAQCIHPDKDYKLVDLMKCRCNKICPFVLRPVCVEDKNGNHKEFPNNCYFEIEQCKHPENEYKLVDLGLCCVTTDCNKICTLEYDPVCAEDQYGNYRKFWNKCVFELEQCNHPETEFKSVPLSTCYIPPHCVKICTPDCNPVCAEDKNGNHREFPNKCSFEIEDCTHPEKEYKLVSRNKC